MKIKVQDVYNATLILSAIIREKRPLPTKGAYRVARMHSKLLPEFNVANDKRDELIKAYDYKPKIAGPDGETMLEAENFSVPDDKLPEFLKAWREIADVEITIADLEPIPLAQLDLGDGIASSIHAGELLDLGDLVTD